MRPDTRLQHLGEEDKPYGAVAPPIFQNSLFVYPDFDSFVKRVDNAERYDYSRISNPTVTIAQKKIADLERAEACRVFGSGMSAISSAILSQVSAGAHVVCVDTCYGPTRQFFEQYLPRFGVETTFVSGLDADETIDAIRPETTLMYLESPGSIIFRLQDFAKITTACREKGVVTITDNSYSAGVFQQPITLGVDLVVHSATKYLAGHSDLVAGVVAGSKPLIDKISKGEAELITAAIHPFPAWLLIRGLRTLKLRMKHAQEVGNAMAAWLSDQAWVEKVNHVGAPDFEFAALRDRQMSGSASLLSFHPMNDSEEWIRTFMNALEVFQIGVSWGGYESLCVPIQMQPIGWEEPRRVLRLYLGLEDLEDLQEDVTRAASVAG